MTLLILRETLCLNWFYSCLALSKGKAASLSSSGHFFLLRSQFDHIVNSEDGDGSLSRKSKPKKALKSQKSEST
jgi:hypothetical protein